MAESSSISIPKSEPPTPSEITSQPPVPQSTTTAPPSNPTTFAPPSNPTTFVPPSNPTSTIVVDKTLSSTANLVKLLPSGTVLAFQSLSPIFSNHGNCMLPDKMITGFLIVFSAFTCFLFSFSDSFVGSNGKHYYGMATMRGLYIINKENSEEEALNVGIQNHELRRYRIRFVDIVHAFFSSFFFLAIAFSDSNVQTCLFPTNSLDTLKELFMNLPMGVGLLSGLVFMIFPTTRKGIGYAEHPNA